MKLINKLIKNGTKPYLVIDIGRNKMKFLYARCGERLTVYNYFSIDISDIISQNPQEVISQIYEYVKELGLNKKRCILSTSFDEAIVRKYVYPRMEENCIFDNIQYELEELLAINMDKYNIDYRIINEYKRDERWFIDVQVAAIPSDLINRLVHIISKAGLCVESVDLSINGGIKGIQTNWEHSSGYGISTLAVLDIGYDTSNFFILKDGVPILYKVISLGSKDYKDIYGEWIGYMDICSEVLYTMNYFYSNNSFYSIDKLCLYGEAMESRDIIKYFNDNINLPIVGLRELIGNKIQGFDKDSDLDMFFNCVGLIYGR